MKLKKTYTTPASQTLEVKPQGMLCWSQGGGDYGLLLLGTRTGYTDGGEDTWTF